MNTFLTLDKEGVLLAVVFGVAIILLGGGLGIFLFGVTLLFLVLSAIVTQVGKEKKKTLHLYEKSRGWKNVVANGLPPLIIAAVYFLNARYAFVPASVVLISFVSSVGAITADKFSSEIGVLGTLPTEMVSFRKVRRGVSGGVTGAGTFVGMFGSFLVGLSLFLVLPLSSMLVALCVVVLAGLAGDMVDSLLGYYETRGFGNKFTTNVACGISAWLVSLALLALVYV